MALPESSLTNSLPSRYEYAHRAIPESSSAESPKSSRYYYDAKVRDSRGYSNLRDEREYYTTESAMKGIFLIPCLSFERKDPIVQKFIARVSPRTSPRQTESETTYGKNDVSSNDDLVPLRVFFSRSDIAQMSPAISVAKNDVSLGQQAGSPSLTRGEVEALFKRFDKNKDGSISYKEFLDELMGERNESKTGNLKEAPAVSANKGGKAQRRLEFDGMGRPSERTERP